MKKTQRPRKKTMIAVPAMDMCHTLFAKCLYGLQTDPGTPASFARRAISTISSTGLAPPSPEEA